MAGEGVPRSGRIGPEDPAPWSNISAIKFEQGGHASALKDLEKALSLSSSEPDDGPKKQKLLTRMAKCHLHSLSLKDAEQAAKSLADDASGKELREALDGLQKTWSASPEETRAQVVHKLKQWSQSLGDNYAPKKIRPAVLKKFNKAEQQRKMAFGDDSDKTQTEQAHRDFRDFGVVFANDVFLGRREPGLPALLADYRAGRPGAKEKFENHIDTKWQTNPTVLDMDYEPRRANIITPGEPVDLTPSTEWDPMALVKAVAPPSEKNPMADGFASLERFFEHLALSNMVLADRVDFELIAGDMADILERIQHNSLPHRALKPKEKDGLDPTRFPRQYDLIHMSNIPDYVGGPLTALVYGGPLLREDRPANLRFNNLINPPMFQTHEHFLSEYVLMHDAGQLKDHFGLVREKDPHAVPGSFTRMMGVTPFMTENYFIWGRSPGARCASKLMSRPALEHWLHSYLLKIVLPHRRPLGGDRPVLTPLNLTAFLRLVGMLHGVGYPAHWLSAILASVSAGSIMTTARPPRELKAEFTTLLSLWQRILPFGVAAPVPTPEEVRECSVTFDEVLGWHGRVPHFVLVFVNKSVLGDRKLVLPDLLQDDEEGDRSEVAARARESGLHVVTAFTYVTETKTAKFWMRGDVCDEVTQGESWEVCICREDSWEVLKETRMPASKGLQKLGSWTGRRR
ncbi:tetratricopeptide [Colletotrichum sojae]|uniref:Tetratricopeptide n=1 Tax=Colletotrichum sojae TaxID=2175907 RepID=A0A8H6IXH7_9PEZI|nr:tetratricopeptide [Colletotrichum sojae]